MRRLNTPEGGSAPHFFYDRWVLLSTLALVVFGLVMVTSASMVVSDRLYHTPLHFLFRQGFFVTSGLGIAWLMTRIPLHFWEERGHPIFIICLLLLVVVLIPGLGHVVNGSRRWIRLGFMSFQVSEAVKLLAILYLAGYLQRHQDEVRRSISGFVKPMIFLALMGFLLLLEPDFGATSVIAMTFLSLLFIAGARLVPFIGMFSVVLTLMVTLAITSPYRLRRLTSFVDPWLHAYGSGYQLTQSLIAFGRGGVFGVGLGNSVQKLFYLPEAHTDFVFAVIAEELGLLGELLLLGLFVLLVARMIQVGMQALKQYQYFAGYVLWGIALWLSFQAAINIGVNIGLLPTKGLTLPLISYGGSSMWVSCAAIGIALRAAFEVDTLKHGQSLPAKKKSP